MNKKYYIIEVENDNCYPACEFYFVRLTDAELNVIKWLLELTEVKNITIRSMESEKFFEVGKSLEVDNYEHKEG